MINLNERMGPDRSRELASDWATEPGGTDVDNDDDIFATSIDLDQYINFKSSEKFSFFFYWTSLS